MKNVRTITNLFYKLAAMGTLSAVLMTLPACSVKSSDNTTSLAGGNTTISSVSQESHSTLDEQAVDFYEAIQEDAENVPLSSVLEELNAKDQDLVFDPNNLAIIDEKIRGSALIIEEIFKDPARADWLYYRAPFLTSMGENEVEVLPNYADEAALDYLSLNCGFLTEASISYLQQTYHISDQALPYARQGNSLTYSNDLEFMAYNAASKQVQQNLAFFQKPVSDYSQFLQNTSFYYDATSELATGTLGKTLKIIFEKRNWDFVKSQENGSNFRGSTVQQMLGTNLEDFSDFNSYKEGVLSAYGFSKEMSNPVSAPKQAVK